MSTFETPQPISVTIELALGDVRIVAGDRTDTVVAVDPSDGSRSQDVEAAEQTRIEHSDGRLLVKVPKPRGLSAYVGLGARPGSVDLTIELPADSQVTADAGLADFRSEGRLGEVRIKTGAGDIRLDETGRAHLTSGAGSVTLERAIGNNEVTSAGDIRLRGIDGEAQIKNLNGKTWVGEITGALRVKSANGDITVEKAHAEVNAKTANGSIRIGDVVSGAVVLETGSGGLDVGVGEGTAAWVDASSRFGRIHNALEAAEGPAPTEQTAEIRARTSFGDIVIHRS